MDFSLTLRLVRVMTDWSQHQVAVNLCVSPQTVSAWEKGTRRPHPKTIHLLRMIAGRHGVIWNERGYPELAEDGPILGQADLPEELKGIEGIQDLSRRTAKCCGIYFLILRNRVVYVGQSVNAHLRVLDHTRDMQMDAKIKNFNRVLFLNWPLSDLDRIEGALIRLMRPQFNRQIPYERNPGDDKAVLSLIPKDGNWPWDRIELFPLPTFKDLKTKEMKVFDPWKELEQAKEIYGKNQSDNESNRPEQR